MLDGNVSVNGNVVVIGGGMVGMETAEYLAGKGAKVTVLEMMKEFCADMGSTRKICVTESIYQEGITPCNRGESNRDRKWKSRWRKRRPRKLNFRVTTR